AQHPPAPGRLEIERQDLFLVEHEHSVEPCCERRRKLRIDRLLTCNTALDFADTDNADEEIGRALPFEPLHHPCITAFFVKLGDNNRIEEVHQNSMSRGRSFCRGKSTSPRGILRSSSIKDGAWARSRSRRRSNSPALTTTTAGLPCLVTVCGSRLAALTTSLNRFLAS